MMGHDRALHADAFVVLGLAILVAYGGVWTRGVQGDDLCMCELASMHGYWEAVRLWLQNWNGRVFLALTQIGSYSLPGFAQPLEARWYLFHAAVILAHGVNCILLFRWLAGGGVAAGLALPASLVLAVHPFTIESVLWLAAAYGYVFGTLLAMLAVQTYFVYDRTLRWRWLILSIAFALAASLGIEQYLVVLGALAVLNLARARWHRPRAPAWLPLLIMAGCAVAFLALHFGLFPSTAGRLARVAVNAGSSEGPGLGWKLAWYLSLVPGASPWGGFMQIGVEMVRQHTTLGALVALLALGAAWRVAMPGAWPNQVQASPTHVRPWLFASGAVVFLAALAPFLFTGKYGVSLRNLYLALPGLLTAGSAVLTPIADSTLGRQVLRLVLVPAVAIGMVLCLVADIGAQGVFAHSWSFHRQLIQSIQADADIIRAAGSVRVTGIPPRPYKAIAQIDSSWAFPCLVRWTVADSQVTAWNNLMAPNPRVDWSHAHQIRWPGY